MGGKIGLSSQPGSGSTFYFSLPLQPAQPAEVPSPNSAGPPNLQRSGSGNPIRILAADDAEDNRVLLTHYFRGEPVEIRFAVNGQEAVDIIHRGHEFDLILMDIDMPVLNGYEATKRICEWQTARGETRTPIVGLSAHAMQEAVRECLDAGCVAHLAKPIDQATLLSAVQRYTVPGETRRPRRLGNAERVPGVAALVPGYLASKPRQIEEARAALALEDFEPVQRFGHNLKGTGPGYGFPRIEEIGIEIEAAAADRDGERIAKSLEALHCFITEVAVSKVRSEG